MISRILAKLIIGKSKAWIHGKELAYKASSSNTLHVTGGYKLSGSKESIITVTHSGYRSTFYFIYNAAGNNELAVCGSGSKTYTQGTASCTVTCANGYTEFSFSGYMCCAVVFY